MTTDRAEHFEHRARWLRTAAARLEGQHYPELWVPVLLEAGAFAAALPALRAGRRCGAHTHVGFVEAVWPGLFHGTATACQACHGSGELGWCDHTLGCWMSVDGGDDPAMVGACGCGALVTAPRWAVQSPAGVGCPGCSGRVELRYAGLADRWADEVRQAGPPLAHQVDELRPLVDALARLQPGADVWVVAAHCAALTRLRIRQAQRPIVLDPRWLDDETVERFVAEARRVYGQWLRGRNELREVQA